MFDKVDQALNSLTDDTFHSIYVLNISTISSREILWFPTVILVLGLSTNLIVCLSGGTFNNSKPKLHQYYFEQ